MELQGSRGPHSNTLSALQGACPNPGGVGNQGEGFDYSGCRSVIHSQNTSNLGLTRSQAVPGHEVVSTGSVDHDK